MKLKSIFMSMFALAALASCSNDEQLPSGNPDINVDGREAYMSLSLAMPSNGPGTRAVTTGHGENYEQQINKVLLVLFDDNAICLDTIPLGAADYKLNVGGSDVANEHWDAFKVDASTKKILVAINPSDKFKTACVKTSAWSVINAAVDEEVKNVAEVVEETAGVKKGNFMMINAGNNTQPNAGALVAANVKIVDGTTILNETKAKEEAKKDPSKVNVDRVVAKVTLQEKTGGATVDNGASCTFGDWALNITNKSMYPYSEIVIPAGASVDASNVPADYRIDPNYELADFNVSKFNYLKVASDGTLPADFSAMTDSKYCLENTMNAVAQTQAQTTAAVVSAVYTPNSFDKGKSWFRLLGVTYKTLIDLQTVYNAAKAAATPDALQTQIITLCDQFYTRMKAAATNQSKTFSAANFASITIAELDAIENGGEYSKPAAGQTVGVEYFKKGVCYYNILIRHDSNITGNMALGKYGVVRNNWYTITINSVSQPGSPWLPDNTDPTDPKEPGEDDDPKDAYLAVTITVNPWTTWSQGVEL